MAPEKERARLSSGHHDSRVLRLTLRSGRRVRIVKHRGEKRWPNSRTKEGEALDAALTEIESLQDELAQSERRCDREVASLARQMLYLGEDLAREIVHCKKFDEEADELEDSRNYWLHRAGRLGDRVDHLEMRIENYKDYKRTQDRHNAALQAENDRQRRSGL